MNKWKSLNDWCLFFEMWITKTKKAETAKTIDFAAARDEGLNHLDEIVLNYEAEIALAREEFRIYLSENISYSIDANMQKGLELFFRLAHKNQLIERCKPLAFITGYWNKPDWKRSSQPATNTNSNKPMSLASIWFSWFRIFFLLL